MAKRNLREHFIEGWNKLFGKEEDKTKLRTQSLIQGKKFSHQISMLVRPMIGKT